MENTPECRIAFNPEKQLWGYQTKFSGHPVHDQCTIYPTIETALLGADPHQERV